MGVSAYCEECLALGRGLWESISLSSCPNQSGAMGLVDDAHVKQAGKGGRRRRKRVKTKVLVRGRDSLKT